MSSDKLDTAKQLIVIALNLLKDVIDESSNKSTAEITINQNAFKDLKTANQYFDDFTKERLVSEIGSELDRKDILKEYKNWLQSEPDKKKLSPADVRQKLIDKFGKPLSRKGKEMFQGVRIASLIEDMSTDTIKM